MNRKMDTEDKKQLEGIYLKYQTALRKLACANDIPPDYVDDMVQDTFVAFTYYGYSLDLPAGRMKLLLSRILKNKCADYHRRMKYRAALVLEDSTLEERGVVLEENGPGIPEIVIGRERFLTILREIDRMPQNWREVAVLRMIEGRSTKEICGRLNISEKAFYSRMGRIRKHLRQQLGSEGWL